MASWRRMMPPGARNTRSSNSVAILGPCDSNVASIRIRDDDVDAWWKVPGDRGLATTLSAALTNAQSSTIFQPIWRKTNYRKVSRKEFTNRNSTTTMSVGNIWLTAWHTYAASVVEFGRCRLNEMTYHNVVSQAVWTGGADSGRERTRSKAGGRDCRMCT